MHKHVNIWKTITHKLSKGMLQTWLCKYTDIGYFWTMLWGFLQVFLSNINVLINQNTFTT